MKRIPVRRWRIWLGFSLLLVSVLASAAEVSVKALVTTPAHFDGQTVTIRGTAIAVKATVSKKGNPYTTFQVQDANGAAVKVFAWEHPAVKDGGSVEVAGVFHQVKRVGRYTFYNEVEAQSVRPLTR